MGALRFLALGAAVCFALVSGVVTAVDADELVLPYSCTMDRGAPRLVPAEDTSYPIIGSHDDMPFTACASSAAWTCETMMVHKFTIDCGGQRVSWSKVAASARSLGVALPDKLPPGYAPVGKLRGRFVLPGFVNATKIAPVTSELLSRDAVLTPAAPRHQDNEAPWVTVVDPASAATATAPSASSNALKVAGVISTLLVSLMGACLLLVRRRQIGPFEFSAGLMGSMSATARVWDIATAPFWALRRSFENWRSSPAGMGEEESFGALGPVHKRLHETEYLIAALPTDLLLRDVLASELDSLYDRVADLGRRADQLEPERLRSAVRVVMRDLDRISRIAEGAMPVSEDTHAAAIEPDVPTTAFEAYRVLGLNSNAPDAAVKKIVDALRMSWHPDHAHDEADRRYREHRIKQINAAWDLLKAPPAAAA